MTGDWVIAVIGRRTRYQNRASRDQRIAQDRVIGATGEGEGGEKC